MLVPVLVLLALQAAPADTVHTRDGKKFEGRLAEYSRFVEVEGADGKKTRHLRQEVTRIDYAPAFIHFPEFASHPEATTDKEFQFETRASRRHLILIGKRPSVKIVAIDVAKAVKVWEKDVPNRAAEPVLEGPLVYFLQREKLTDESRKIKVRGAPVPREVHKITVLAVVIETGETAFTFTIDNTADRKDYWEYSPVAPVLEVFPDRILVGALKSAYAVDPSGSMDKDKPRRIAGFTAYDVEKKRILHSFDTPDAAEVFAIPEITNELIAYLTPVDRSRLKLVGASARDGKIRWQGEPVPIPSKIVAANEDQIYLSDDKVLTAWSSKTGKKVDKWSIDLALGIIPYVDAAYVYFHLDKKDPQAIVGYDAKKGTEAWRIDAKEGKQFPQIRYFGHRLVYVDKTNTLFLFDTVQKKELWRSPGVASNFLQNLGVFGSGISFYRDARVQFLDLESGRKVWEIRSPQDARVIRSIFQVGDAGILAQRTSYTDIIRERKPPAGAVFLTPTGTPLLHALGDGPWSLPAIGPETMTTLSATGTLASVRISDRSLVWSNKLTDGAHPALPAPFLHGVKFVVQVRDEAVVLGPDGKTRTAAAKNHLPRFDRACEVVGQNLVAFTSSGISTTDTGTGVPGWGWSAKGVQGYGISGETAWVLCTEGVVAVNLRNGEVGSKLPPAPDSTWVVPDGKRAFVAQGPYGFGVTAPDRDFQPLFRAKNQDRQIQQTKFRGSIAVAAGTVVYSHSDGQVSCFSGADGKPLWAFATPQFSSPLLLHSDRVWFAAAGVGLVALDVKTGAVGWKLELPDAALFTPFVWEGKPAFWSNEGWIVRPE